MHDNYTQELPLTFKALNLQLYEAVFKKYYPSLYHFTKRLVGDKQEAQDIVTDTLLKLWYRKDDFNSLPNVTAFLYVTARNTALSYIRNIQRREKHHEGIALQAEESDEAFDRRMIMTEIVKMVYDEIESLPEKRGIILKMFYLEELGIPEIAKRLDITESTVRSQKYKAIKGLRKLVLKKILMSLFFIGKFYYAFNTVSHYFRNWFK